MKVLFFTFGLLLTSSLQVQSQDMDNEKLGTLLELMSDSLQGGMGSWQFMIDDVFMMCITDQVNNRMRIISPIKEMKEITDEEIGNSMEANFHSALDVRYAISDNIMWVAFIHPLKELTQGQVLDALSQVYSGALTFGTTYTSTHLTFPEAEKKKGVEKKF